MTEASPDVGPVSSEPSVRRGARVPDDPSLSVCILVLERAQLALDCLDALRQPGGSPPGTELVVVANGTSADQLESLAGHEDVVLVVNRENLGFAGGCNQAASVARAPLVVFLNDDSTVDKGCIEALVRAASEDPEIGAVGARIVSVDGTLEEAGSVLWRDGSAAHVGKGLPPGSDAHRERRDVDYVSANGLLVTRRAWDLAQGFDERYFPAYFEDVDLCLALSERGFRIRYEPQALVVHQGSQSTSVVFREFLLRRNQRKLVEKWGPAPGTLRAAACEGLRACVRRRSGAGDQADAGTRELDGHHGRRRGGRRTSSTLRCPPILPRRPQTCGSSIRPTSSNASPTETDGWSH